MVMLVCAGFALFADLGLLAVEAAEVVELRPAYDTAGNDLELVNHRGVHGEGTFHSDAEAHLANGEAFAHPGTGAADDDALEYLDSAAATFDDLDVDADGVTGAEIRDVVSQRCGVDVIKAVHGDLFPQVPQVTGACQAAVAAKVSWRWSLRAGPLWQS